MNYLIKTLGILSLSIISSQVQAQWTAAAPSTQTDQCNMKDLIIDTTYKRFGILSKGDWGGTDIDDQFINIGAGGLGNFGPCNRLFYGMTSAMNTDKMFVGLKYIGNTTVNGCLSDYPYTNLTDAVIAWGNDNAIDGNGASGGVDRLKFEFYNWNNLGTTPTTTVATMLPNGNVGIGTENPTVQLHTTAGVRFQGLTTGTVTNLVGIDANGVLYRTTGGGTTNSCATVNFIPKTTNTLGALSCSQLFDNGTSVGIGSTGPFGYTWSGGLSGTTAPPSSGNLKLDINGVSRALAYFATSDRRFKEDIKPIENAMDIIAQLNPVRYKWTSQKIQQYEFNAMPQIGFIAQEVSEVIPEAVIKDENGYYSMNYIEIIPILTKAIKEQQKQIDELTSIISRQKTFLNETKSKIYQNYPNPHSGHTTVKYEINEDFKEAGIYLLDMNGNVLIRKPIKTRGQGEITFEMSTMKPGIYMYSLVIDGEEKETKKMTFMMQ